MHQYVFVCVCVCLCEDIDVDIQIGMIGIKRIFRHQRVTVRGNKEALSSGSSATNPLGPSDQQPMIFLSTTQCLPQQNKTFISHDICESLASSAGGSFCPEALLASLKRDKCCRLFTM